MPARNRNELRLTLDSYSPINSAQTSPVLSSIKTQPPLPFHPSLRERNQSYSSDLAQSMTSTSERSPLLRSSLSTKSLRGLEEDEVVSGSPGRTDAWASSLKRKSAVISDMLSGRNHSSWTLPTGADDLTEDEGEDGERAPLIGGSRSGRSGGKKVLPSLRNFGRRKNKSGGYDNDFREELEGEGGTGVRQW